MYSLIPFVNIYGVSTFCRAVGHRCEQTDMLCVRGKLQPCQNYERKHQEVGSVI